jgi:hypothetical protein
MCLQASRNRAQKTRPMPGRNVILCGIVHRFGASVPSPEVAISVAGFAAASARRQAGARWCSIPIARVVRALRQRSPQGVTLPRSVRYSICGDGWIVNRK